MYAIDTNVLARYLLNDDANQSVIADATVAAGVFVPVTVVVELCWLLSSRYRQSRDVVASSIIDILDLPSVTVADAAGIRWAVARFAAGAEFADMIHLIGSASMAGFATFDRAIATDAGSDGPVGIETLD